MKIILFPNGKHVLLLFICPKTSLHKAEHQITEYCINHDIIPPLNLKKYASGYYAWIKFKSLYEAITFCHENKIKSRISTEILE